MVCLYFLFFPDSGRLCIARKVPISARLWNLLVYNCSKKSPKNFCSISCNVSLIFNFESSLFFVDEVKVCQCYLFGESARSFILSIVSLFPSSFIYAVYFIFCIPPLTLGLTSSSFPWGVKTGCLLEILVISICIYCYTFLSDSFYCIPLVLMCFISFHLFQGFFSFFLKFPFTFFFTHWLFRSVL